MNSRNSFYLFLICSLFLNIALPAALRAIPTVAEEETTKQKRSGDERNSSQAGNDSDNTVSTMEATRGSVNQTQVREGNVDARAVLENSSSKPQGTSVTVTTGDGRTIEFPVVGETKSAGVPANIKQNATAKLPKSDIRNFFVSKSAERFCAQQREPANAGESSSSIKNVVENVTTPNSVPVAVPVKKASSGFATLKSEKSTGRDNENVVIAEAVYPEVPEIEVTNFEDQRRKMELNPPSAPEAAVEEERSPQQLESLSPAASSRITLEETTKKVTAQKQAKAEAEEAKKQEKLLAEITLLSNKVKAYCELAENASQTNLEAASEAFLKAAGFAQQALEANEGGDDELSNICDQAATAAKKFGEEHQKLVGFEFNRKFKEEKIIVTFNRALDYFNKAIEATKNNSPAASDWKEAARLVMLDFKPDPNRNRTVSYKPGSLSDSAYHNSLNLAIECYEKAATVSLQEASELNQKKIVVLRRAGKACELSVTSGSVDQRQEYAPAAKFYTQKIPAAVEQWKRPYYTNALDRLGDLHYFAAEMGTRLTDNGIYKYGCKYNEQILRGLDQGNVSPNLNWIQVVQAYHNYMEASYENLPKEEKEQLFYKAQREWDNYYNYQANCTIS